MYNHLAICYIHTFVFSDGRYHNDVYQRDINKPDEFNLEHVGEFLPNSNGAEITISHYFRIFKKR